MGSTPLRTLLRRLSFVYTRLPSDRERLAAELHDCVANDQKEPAQNPHAAPGVLRRSEPVLHQRRQHPRDVPRLPCVHVGQSRSKAALLAVEEAPLPRIIVLLSGFLQPPVQSGCPHPEMSPIG